MLRCPRLRRRLGVALVQAVLSCATADAATAGQAEPVTTTTTVSTTTTTTIASADCGNWDVQVRLDAADAAVGALQVRVDYAAAVGAFAGSGADVVCTTGLQGVNLAAHHDAEERELAIGWVAVGGIEAGPVIARCLYIGAFATPPVPGDFLLAIEDAVSTSVEPIDVELSIELEVLTAPGECLEACGDGVVSGLETCDDANTTDTDSCLSTCVRARCGDLVVREGVEQCEDGNTSNNDQCVNCASAVCGDGFVRHGFEQCDDGGDDDGDACPSSCKSAFCGDGFVRTGLEECDDGNATKTDGCIQCVLARCGDGFLHVGVEECDYEDPGSSAGCSPNCLYEPALCGDADFDGNVVSNDALRALRAAVGLPVGCPMQVCDVNRSGSITVLDALSVLRLAVGAPVAGACGLDA